MYDITGIESERGRGVSVQAITEITVFGFYMVVPIVLSRKSDTTGQRHYAPKPPPHNSQECPSATFIVIPACVLGQFSFIVLSHGHLKRLLVIRFQYRLLSVIVIIVIVFLLSFPRLKTTLFATPSTWKPRLGTRVRNSCTISIRTRRLLSGLRHNNIISVYYNIRKSNQILPRISVYLIKYIIL